MRDALKRLSLVFAAGIFGGLVNALLRSFLSQIGFLAFFEVIVKYPFTAEHFHSTILWGGIWGIFFVFPLLEHSTALRGLAFGFIPALAELFIILPFIDGKGFMGVDSYGRLTPFFIVFFNIAWGVAASSWLHIIDFERIKPKTWYPPGPPR
ncbi:MAG: hypothetical protein ACYS8W_00625 [Planctomycetota bacterium]|jgi:hypothetical protein